MVYMCFSADKLVVFRYIWFIYVFSADKLVILDLFTDGTEITEKQLPAGPFCPTAAG